MSPSIILPSPLPAGSISIGQLITDPSQDNIASFSPSTSGTTFSTLCTIPAAQRFLIDSTIQHRKIYFVSGIQASKNPTSAPTAIANAATSASEPFTRPDSAVDLGADSKEAVHISALELLPIRCRVGFSSEPHSVDDVEYKWTYHKLNDEGLQLSIGTGKAVESLGEKKAAREDEGSDMDWSYGSDEEEGLGGF